MNNLTLLTNEQEFLNSSAVTRDIDFTTIWSAQANAENAQKAKFDKSIELAVMVANASAWFDKAETKALLEQNDIVWENKETFFKRVFGWQKSFAYKMVKAGNLSTDVVDAFKAHCTAQEEAGVGSNRSIAGLLKFAKGDTERPSKAKALATLSIAKNGLNGEKGFSIRINNDGSIDVSGEIIDGNIDYNIQKLFGKLQRIANA